MVCSWLFKLVRYTSPADSVLSVGGAATGYAGMGWPMCIALVQCGNRLQDRGRSAVGDRTVKKIGLFADVQNIYYTTRQAYGRQFDYWKLWRSLSEQGDIAVAYAYATHRGDDGQLKFQNALREIGFTVKLKPYLQRRDGSAKGDWDVGITIDVLEAVKQKLDVVVLLSGDGDFDLLLEHVKRAYGVTPEVYGVPSLTANSLIDAASFFHPINEGLLR